ncbi:hypothetical protein GQ53DRAFT_742729 [Thozetella sp. PMI_491]|nr:hypothetical protein GQ53DRAFT_742729 [Thozetella sp. PMI_491]
MDELGTTGEGDGHGYSIEAGDPHRPYHSKRPHKKSRKGCKNCKARKVKCDEARPACKHCQLRKEVCVYPLSSAGAAGAATTKPGSSSPVSASRSGSPPDSEPIAGQGDDQVVMHLQPAGIARYTPPDNGLRLFTEPLFIPQDTDQVDLRLLWLYTTTTYGSFSTNSGKLVMVDEVLKVKIPQYAFQSPFLMDSILGLAAQHLKYLAGNGEAPVAISMTKALAYRARAFEGYRKAVEAARPEDYPAIIAASLILCALASETLRDENCKPLYIVDWMIVWRGIGLMIDLISPEEMIRTGLAPLFSRPPINLEAAALHIPSNLLFMATSIKADDPDFASVDTYYDTLKYLGSLYQELEDGFSAILNLRIIVWFTFLPKPFVELARQLRPRTLIVFAHYLVFAKLVQEVWWMSNISDREIRNISTALGDEWATLLRVPLMALGLTDKAEIARLLLNNHSWEPVVRDKETRDLGLVDDVGREVIFAGRFEYKYPTRTRPVWNTKDQPARRVWDASESPSASDSTTPSP